MEPRMTGKQQVAGRNPSANLLAVVRHGTAHDVELALAAVKKAGASLDGRDRFGSTALHIAAWRNHVPIVKRLLAAGADPDARDGESGWGSLHRALHFGHLAVAGAFIDSGVSFALEDGKGRIPVDLVSGNLNQVVGAADLSHGILVRELFGWGNGSNYQLGTGTTGIQRVPCRVEALHDADVVAISAAKFHSVAVTSKGELYSWGYGRGGRLGHEDYSGETAVIAPRQVTSILSGRCVKVVAAAKDHTIVATEGGEVYTWGNNREGQLGYPSVDTQSSPRRVSALKAKVVAVAAANKHSVAVTEAGEVFTWGCNLDGQLGYGISNSASNCVPRVVDYLKGRRVVAVAAAKRHTVALVEGEVFSWGYRMVSPRRVPLARNTRKAGQVPLKFHQTERLQIVGIAAGVVHSTAISADGLVFTWLSADPQFHAQQVLSMTGLQVTSVSAGKFRTAVVTATGDVYAWDSERSPGAALPVPLRIQGIKRATQVAAGETHSLAITEIYVPSYSPAPKIEQVDEDDPLPQVRKAPSLKQMCQDVIATSIVEPKNALQLLEYADALEADDLKLHCENMILHNLDYMIQFYASSFGAVRSSVLADLEKSWDARSSEPWSHRRLPVPSATIPATVDSEEDENESSFNPRVFKGFSVEPLSGFLQDDRTGDKASKHVRALRKKLQQIEALEVRVSKGQSLDEQQLAKVRSKGSTLAALRELDGQTVVTPPLKQPEERPKRKARKGKKRVTEAQLEENSQTAVCGVKLNTDPISKEDITPDGGNIDSNAISKEDPTPNVPDKAPDAEASKAPVVEDSKAPATATVKQSVIAKLEAQFPRLERKPKCKKGGLSMFLSGELEKKPAPTPKPAPLVVKTDGPAWGGAKRRVETTSLSDIQNQQRAESSTMKATTPQKDASPAEVQAERSQRISLQHFVRSPASSGMATSPGMSSPKAPWVGTPPGVVPSLKAIQMQEVKHKEQQQQRVFGFATASSSVSEPGNCWFKPETSSPSSIRCIQIEEKAMKDLRRLYKHVKMVNPNS